MTVPSNEPPPLSEDRVREIVREEIAAWDRRAAAFILANQPVAEQENQ